MLISLSFILASYRQHYLRSLVVMLAILAAGAGFSSVLILNETAKQSYQQASQPLLNNVYARVISSTQLDKHQYSQLRRMGFTQLVPVMRDRLTLFTDNGEFAFEVNLIAMDMYALLSLPQQIKVDSKQSHSLDKALSEANMNVLSRSNALIHQDYADELGLSRQKTLFLEDGTIFADIEISQQAGLGRQVFLDVASLQAITGSTLLTEIFVVGSLNSKLNQRLANQLPEGLTLENIATGEQATELTASFHLNLRAMSLLMFVVCMFVVMNALNLLILKRLASFKLLRQLGVSRANLYGAMSVEVIVICIIATTLSIFCGISLAKLLSPAVSQTLSNLYNVHLNYQQLSFIEVLLKTFSVVVVGALAALVLPIRLLNHKLAATQFSRDKRLTSVHWLITSIVFLIMAVVIAVTAKNLASSFIAIAFFVFAGCFFMIDALPRTIKRIQQSIPSDFPLLNWSIADSIKATRLSKIAYCAFFIAVACNIGMNLMVDSFRQATEDWLTQRLHASGYLYTNQPQQLSQFVEAQSLNIELVPRKRIDATIASIPISINSYPTGQAFQQAMVFEHATDDVWSIFNAQQGLLINQQLALAHGYSVNDTVELLLADQPSVTKTIAGIYYDYGNTEFQGLLPLKELNVVSPDSRMFAVFSPSGNDFNQLSSALASSEIEYRLFNTDELMAVSMQTFDKTFAITKSLNWITLFIAAFSLASSIVVIDMDNQSQRALMRSLGVSKSRLFQLGLLQYLLTSLVVCFIAIPFGVLLSWLLINLVNAQAFYWTYPLQVFGASIWAVILASLAIVCLVSAIPLFNINRRSLGEDVKWLE